MKKVNKMKTALRSWKFFLMMPYENKEKAWVVSNDYPLYGKYEVVYSKEQPEGYIYARRFPKLDDLDGDLNKIKDTMAKEYLWWFCGER